MFLLDDLILAPAKAVKWAAEKLREVADKELYDADKIREELMTLQAKFDMGEIVEEEFKLKEKELIERLEEIRRREEGE